MKKKIYVSFIVVFFMLLYIILSFFDILYLYLTFVVTFEYIINGVFIVFSYLPTFIRASIPYLIILIGFIMLSKKNKVFGMNLTKQKSKAAYLNFYLKEYIFGIILFIHLLFITVIYNYELYYNDVIIISIVCFYFFIGLSIYIKRYLIKHNMLDKKILNSLVNASLIVALGACFSTIIDTINQHINFQIDLLNYLYSAIARNGNDRLLLKFINDPANNWFRTYHWFKNHKANMNYIYLKKQILNNNVLNELCYNKSKFLLYNEKNTKSKYSSIINHENLNNSQINKVNLQSLNNANNNVCSNKYDVWYNVWYENQDDLKNFNNIKKKNWKANFYHLHDYNSSDFLPTDLKLKKVTYLLKNNNVYDNDIKKLLLPKKMVKSFNDYTLLKEKSIYKMDILDILKKKKWYINHDSYRLLGFKTIYGDHSYKYNNVSKIIKTLKYHISHSDFDKFHYKYNYLMILWEKKFYIVQQIYINSYNTYTKQYNLNVSKIVKKSLKSYIVSLKSSKYLIYNHTKVVKNTPTITIDRKSLYLEYYKPYAKYPKYIYTTKSNFIKNSKTSVFGLQKGNMTIKRFNNYKNFDIVLRQKAEKEWYGAAHDAIYSAFKHDKAWGPIIRYTCTILDLLGLYNRQYRDYHFKYKDNNLLFFNQDKNKDIIRALEGDGFESWQGYTDYIINNIKFLKALNIYNLEDWRRHIGLLHLKYNQFQLWCNILYVNTETLWNDYLNSIVNYINNNKINDLYYEKDLKVLTDFIMSVAQNKIADERYLENIELSLKKLLSTQEGAQVVAKFCYNDLDFEFYKFLEILKFHDDLQINYKFNSIKNPYLNYSVKQDILKTRPLAFQTWEEYKELSFKENLEAEHEQFLNRAIMLDIAYDYAAWLVTPDQRLLILKVKFNTLCRGVEKYSWETYRFVHEELARLAKEDYVVRHNIEIQRANQQDIIDDLREDAEGYLGEWFDERRLLKLRKFTPQKFLKHYKCDPKKDPELAANLLNHYRMIMKMDYLKAYQVLGLHYEVISLKTFLESFQNFVLLDQEYIRTLKIITLKLDEDEAAYHNQQVLDLLRSELHISNFLERNNKYIIENIIEKENKERSEQLKLKKIELDASRLELNKYLKKYTIAINKDWNAYNYDRYKNYDGVKSFEDLKKKWLK